MENVGVSEMLHCKYGNEKIISQIDKKIVYFEMEYQKSKFSREGLFCKIFRNKVPTTLYVKFNKFLLTTLILVGTVGGLRAKPDLYQGMSQFIQLTNILRTEKMPVEPLTNKTSVSEATENIVIEAGTTWSYTEHITAGEVTLAVKTYFVFTSPTDVVWLFGTPKGNMFPVGFGKFNPSNGIITFSAYDKLHKKIALYYNSNTIVFYFDPSSGNARLKSKDDDHYLDQFYNEGRSFNMSKENYTVAPRKDLVGTFWECEDDGEKYVVYFKSWNEAVLIGIGESEEACAYIYIDDMVSIKSGDNITDENLIGRYRGGNEMPLCREGIDPYGDVFCVTLRKVK